MKNSWKSFALAGLIMITFPVLITFAVSKMNGSNKSETALSGKTIIVETDGYIAEMDMENFIPCVLMAQLPIDSPIEVLKAQAVVIRTYILKQMGNETSIRAEELGFPFISYGQMEEMWFREYRMEHPGSIEGLLGNLTGLGKSRIFDENLAYLRVVMEKTGMKILKNSGKLILPLYHGISNGTTREGSGVLGSDYAYLKSVECGTDVRQENFLSVKYFSLEDIKESLEENDIIVYDGEKELFSSENLDLQSFLQKIDCSNKDEAGYLISIKIGDTEIAAEDFAKALQLASTSMEVSEYEEGIRITTKGEGHGFGMSLAYAEQLAKEGMNWKKILKTFYDTAVSEY